MSFWHGRSVFLTGHTGFKGGWMAHYLDTLGASVHGYSRARTAHREFYEVAEVRRRLASETTGDLRDLTALRAALHAARPSVVVHMAARAIVRESIEDPAGVVETNVVGSTNVLEAVRRMPDPPVVVLVTTDKVYRNRTGRYAFWEGDELGGLSPYGASKAAVELITDAYRHTYGLEVATARCANVVGGGDWGRGRLVPNAIQAAETGGSVTVHDATRVFLHVLDAVDGYTRLGRALVEGFAPPRLNFGPRDATVVEEVARMVVDAYGSGTVQPSNAAPSQESQHLAIDSTEAEGALGWAPRWTLGEALDATVRWHQAHANGADMDLVTRQQIEEYRG